MHEPSVAFHRKMSVILIYFIHRFRCLLYGARTLSSLPTADQDTHTHTAHLPPNLFITLWSSIFYLFLLLVFAIYDFCSYWRERKGKGSTWTTAFLLYHWLFTRMLFFPLF